VENQWYREYHSAERGLGGSHRRETITPQRRNTDAITGRKEQSQQFVLLVIPANDQPSALD
jgi:hypothetical protein